MIAAYLHRSSWTPSHSSNLFKRLVRISILFLQPVKFTSELLVFSALRVYAIWNRSWIWALITFTLAFAAPVGTNIVSPRVVAARTLFINHILSTPLPLNITATLVNPLAAVAPSQYPAGNTSCEHIIVEFSSIFLAYTCCTLIDVRLFQTDTSGRLDHANLI